MPLTPTGTRELLSKLGHQPKHFLGQNFLVDGNIVRKSLELAGIKAGDHVVEIGPGLGTLTSALLEAGAEVWAVEKDRHLHAHLLETLVPNQPRLHLLEGDAMDHPLAGFLEAGCPHPSSVETPRHDPPDSGPPPNFKIVANLPYAISTPWMDAVLSGPLPVRMVLMLQQEAAQRYVAAEGSKTFGAISIFLQSAFAVQPGHKVPASCFYPRPDIESVLLNLVQLPAPFVFPAAAKALIRACFQQRRKQLGSILRGKLPPEKAAAWFGRLAAAGHGPQSRAEQIPVALWRDLSV
ncbi:MAG TPA: 16S rRNA (adenine(1518)-N(6)/adenine(1519)-N(6))-dimethyltransferase RsmA [Lacunisphaera sp.]|nr:16S rRNA (adenine(1518)-N(6)/adenine(1519)-N(6))-dimethyltransferase RsmA [Lacunisphaera sp.]